MPLSEEELRLLEQMERALVQEDPKFASTLRGTTLRRAARRRAVVAGVCFLVGIGVLMAGAILQLTPLGIAGFVVMLASATVGLTAWRGRSAAGRSPQPVRRQRPHRHRRRPPVRGGRGGTAAVGSGSFMQRHGGALAAPSRRRRRLLTRHSARRGRRPRRTRPPRLRAAAGAPASTERGSQVARRRAALVTPPSSAPRAGLHVGTQARRPRRRAGRGRSAPPPPRPRSGPGRPWPPGPPRRRCAGRSGAGRSTGRPNHVRAPGRAAARGDRPAGQVRRRSTTVSRSSAQAASGGAPPAHRRSRRAPTHRARDQRQPARRRPARGRPAGAVSSTAPATGVPVRSRWRLSGATSALEGDPRDRQLLGWAGAPAESLGAAGRLGDALPGVRRHAVGPGGRGRLEPHPAGTREVQLGPGVQVPGGVLPGVGAHLVGSQEARPDPGGDAQAARHHRHRRGELLAVADPRRPRKRHQGVGAVALGGREVVAEPAVRAEPLLERDRPLVAGGLARRSPRRPGRCTDRGRSLGQLGEVGRRRCRPAGPRRSVARRSGRGRTAGHRVGRAPRCRAPSSCSEEVHGLPVVAPVARRPRPAETWDGVGQPPGVEVGGGRDTS